MAVELGRTETSIYKRGQVGEGREKKEEKIWRKKEGRKGEEVRERRKGEKRMDRGWERGGKRKMGRGRRKRREEVKTILTPPQCGLGIGALGHCDRHSRLLPHFDLQVVTLTGKQGDHVRTRTTGLACKRLRSETRKTTFIPRGFLVPCVTQVYHEGPLHQAGSK